MSQPVLARNGYVKIQQRAIRSACVLAATGLPHTVRCIEGAAAVLLQASRRRAHLHAMLSQRRRTAGSGSTAAAAAAAAFG
jgi:hypothetical protein